MSSIMWEEEKLIQKVGNNAEKLGYVGYDQTSNGYVLWLKDTRDVFGTNREYIRGDCFTSMEDAKQRAASSTSAQIFHHMWMVGLSKTGNISPHDTRDIKDSIRDISKGVDKVAREGGERDRKSKKWNILFLVITLISLGIALICLLT